MPSGSPAFRSVPAPVLFAPLLLAVSLVGCFDPVEPLETLVWEAVLLPSGESTVSGQVAMVAGQHQTQVGIGIQGAPEGSRLGWAVRQGTCDGAGERVAPVSAFPAIQISATGDGQSQTVIQRRLGATLAYVTEIFQDVDGTGAVLACGRLVRSEAAVQGG